MKLGNRSSQHNFAMVPNAQIPRSKFNRSFGRKQTFNADYLVPIFLDEVLPGDTFNLSLTSFARLATPIVPFMDNMHMDYFFFFVPNRLIWDNWQKFNGEQENPGDSTDYQDPLAPAVNGAFDAYNKISLLKQAGQQLGINQANSTADIAMKAAQTAATVTSAAKTQKETEILNSRAKKEKLDGDFYGSDKGKTFYYLQKINEVAGGSLDTLNSAKDLLNPFKLLPKKPTTKRIERWDKDGNVTGQIEETWKP